MNEESSPAVFTITNAQVGLTQEQKDRQRRYLISMGLRTVCFLGAVVTSGILRWTLVAGAVLLPYFAVVIASLRKRDVTGTPEAFTGPITTTGPIEIPYYRAE